jgi:hypothetical protein
MKRPDVEARIFGTQMELRATWVGHRDVGVNGAMRELGASLIDESNRNGSGEHVHCGKCGGVATEAPDGDFYRCTVCGARSHHVLGRHGPPLEWSGGVHP